MAWLPTTPLRLLHPISRIAQRGPTIAVMIEALSTTDSASMRGSRMGASTAALSLQRTPPSRIWSAAGTPRALVTF